MKYRIEQWVEIYREDDNFVYGEFEDIRLARHEMNMFHLHDEYKTRYVAAQVVPDENGCEEYRVFAYAKTKGELTKKIKDATLLLN